MEKPRVKNRSMADTVQSSLAIHRVIDVTVTASCPHIRSVRDQEDVRNS